MEFIENEFDPKSEILKELKTKITKKGLSFHPYLAMQAINKEVETQLHDLIVSHFKGMGVETLGACNIEIKEYAEAEESRYQEWQKNKDAKPEEVLGSAMASSVDLKKVKKK